jgi:hypothetical protein
MIMRLWGLLFLILALPVHAGTLALYETKKAQRIGESRLTWLIWDVYDAALYSPAGRWAPNQPFMLELTYLRALDGAQVATKTIEEMQRLGLNNPAQSARWRLLLTDWFANIAPNTRLAAMRNADGSTTFVRDGKTVLGTIPEPAFANTFFDIWLSEESLRPDLRLKLLGLERTTF